MPGTILKEERRKQPRFYVSFPIECRVLPSRNYFYTVSKDLSLGGIKIISNEFIPRNSILKVDINLIDRLLSLKAKVAWCNRERASDRHLVGLEFAEVNQSDKRNLSQFLNGNYPS